MDWEKLEGGGVRERPMGGGEAEEALGERRGGERVLAIFLDFPFFFLSFSTYALGFAEKE